MHNHNTPITLTSFNYADVLKQKSIPIKDVNSYTMRRGNSLYNEALFKKFVVLDDRENNYDTNGTLKKSTEQFKSSKKRDREEKKTYDIGEHQKVACCRKKPEYRSVFSQTQRAPYSYTVVRNSSSSNTDIQFVIECKSDDYERELRTWVSQELLDNNCSSSLIFQLENDYLRYAEDISRSKCKFKENLNKLKELEHEIEGKLKSRGTKPIRKTIQNVCCSQEKLRSALNGHSAKQSTNNSPFTRSIRCGADNPASGIRKTVSTYMSNVKRGLCHGMANNDRVTRHVAPYCSPRYKSRWNIKSSPNNLQISCSECCNSHYNSTTPSSFNNNTYIFVCEPTCLPKVLDVLDQKIEDGIVQVQFNSNDLKAQSYFKKNEIIANNCTISDSVREIQRSLDNRLRKFPDSLNDEQSRFLEWTEHNLREYERSLEDKRNQFADMSRDKYKSSISPNKKDIKVKLVMPLTRIQQENQTYYDENFTEQESCYLKSLQEKYSKKDRINKNLQKTKHRKHTELHREASFPAMRDSVHVISRDWKKFMTNEEYRKKIKSKNITK